MGVAIFEYVKARIRSAAVEAERFDLAQIAVSTADFAQLRNIGDGAERTILGGGFEGDDPWRKSATSRLVYAPLKLAGAG